jgi:hypothetical protein
MQDSSQSGAVVLHLKEVAEIRFRVIIRNVQGRREAGNY